jgi:hypothetical protein
MYGRYLLDLANKRKGLEESRKEQHKKRLEKISVLFLVTHMATLKLDCIRFSLDLFRK